MAYEDVGSQLLDSDYEDNQQQSQTQSTNMLVSDVGLDDQAQAADNQEQYWSEEYKANNKVQPEVDVRTGLPYGDRTEEELIEAMKEKVVYDNIITNPDFYSADNTFKKTVTDRDPSLAPDIVPFKDMVGSTYNGKMHQNKAMLLTSQITAESSEEEDLEIMAEVEKELAESGKHLRQVPQKIPTFDVIDNMVVAGTEYAALGTTVVKNLDPAKLAAGAAAGGKAGLIVGGLSGVGIAPAIIGGVVSGVTSQGKAQSLLTFKDLAKGEILLGMLKPKEGEEAIPKTIAVGIAEKYGWISAASEYAGLSMLLKGAGFDSTIAERIVGMASESGVEMGQTLLEQYAYFEGRKALAEVRGEEFTKDFNDYLDMAEVGHAGVKGFYGSAAVTTVGTAVTAPLSLQNKLEQKATVQDLAEANRMLDEMRRNNNKTVEENVPQPTVKVTDPVKSVVVEPTPIARPEVTRVQNEPTIPGTPITDTGIKDLSEAPDLDMDATLAELNKTLMKSTDDATANFFVGLEDFIGDEQATKAIAELMTANASTLGMSLTEYVENAKLEFNGLESEADTVQAYTSFLEDGRTIITAFNQATPTDVVRQLSEVFRKNISPEMQAIADDFVGVDKGAQWDARAQEQFATGWQNYIATGQAPTAELTGVFQKLHSWMASMYKSVIGMPAEVPMTPEIKQVFDSMLVKKEVAINNEKALEEVVVEEPVDDGATNTLVDYPYYDLTEETTDQPPIVGRTVDDIQEEEALEEEREIFVQPITEPEIIPAEDLMPVEDIVLEEPVEGAPKPKKRTHKAPEPYVPVNRSAGLFDDTQKEENYVPPAEGLDIMDFVQDFKSVRDAMEWIMENGDEQSAAIAKRLKLPTTGVSFSVIDNGVNYGEIGIPRGMSNALGIHVINNGTGKAGIWVRGKTFGTESANMEIVLHEALHAASVGKLTEAEYLISRGESNRLTQAYQELETVYKDSAEVYQQLVAENSPQVEGLNPQAFGNIKEFTAYAFTDPKMQKLLDNLYFGTDKGSSFTKFVDAIRKLFGLSDGEHNALSDTIMLTDQIMPRNTKVAYGEIDRQNALIKAAQDRMEKESVSKAQVQAEPENTDDGAVKRLKRERLARERAQAEYENTLIQLTTDEATGELTADQAADLQKKAYITAMRRMFDAGDVHGRDMLKNQFKAFLVRERRRYADQRKHKALRKSITDKLKKGQPTKEAGKAVVKMEPEVAKALREAYDVIGGLSNKGITKLYNTRLGDGFSQEDMGASLSDRIINIFLDGAVSRNSTGVATLNELNQALRDVLTQSRKQSPLMLAKNQIDGIRGDLLQEINGGNVVDSPSEDTTKLHKARQDAKSWRDKARTSTLGKTLILGPKALARRLSAYSTTPDSKFSQIFDFFDAKQRKMTMVRENTQKIIDMYMQAYGINTEYTMNKQWNADNEAIHTLGDGITYSKSQLRQLYMYTRDESLTNRLVNQFGGENGYMDMIMTLEDILTEQDVQFAEGMASIFKSDEMYNPVNVVYKKLFGIDLARIKDYVPIRSEGYLVADETLKAAQQHTQFQHDSHGRRTGSSAGMVKSRSNNADKVQLRIDGDMSLYTSYVEEMAQFVNYAEQSRLASLVLNDKEIGKAIKVEYGNSAYKSLRDSMEDVFADGIYNRTQYPWLDQFRGNFVKSTIGMSASVFLKQQISVVQGAQNMPVDQYMKGLWDFWLTKGSLTDMLNTDYLKNRRSHIDRDIKNVAHSTEYKKFQLNPTVSNFFTLNVKMGDALAVAQAGWVLNRYYKTQINPRTGFQYTNEEAWAHASGIMEGTQQSSAMQELSPIQRAGSVAGILTMYSTGPIQAARQEVEAFKDVIGGRISKKQFAKTFGIYHLLVPAMYSLSASWLSGDDKDEYLKSLAIAMSLGPFGSSYVIGSVVSESARRFAGLGRYEVQNPFHDVVDDLQSWAGDMAKGDFEEITLDDWAKVIQQLTVLTGRAVPVQRFTRVGENLADGNVKEAVFTKKPESN